MKTEKYYNALKAGREVVILGSHDQNSSVFWMAGGVICSWTRELGMMERDDMTADRFTNHCKKMLDEHCLLFIRG